MLLAWFVSAAFAWTPDRIEGADLGRVDAVAVGTFGGRTVLVGVGGGVLTLVDPKAGRIGSLEGVAAAAFGDPGGGMGVELVACSEGGVRPVTWDAEAGLALGEVLAPVGCTALAVAAPIGGVAGLFAVSDGALVRWASATGGFVATMLPPAVGPTSRLAVSGVGAAVIGAEGLALRADTGLPLQPTPVVGLAGLPPDASGRPSFVTLAGSPRVTLATPAGERVVDGPANGVVTRGSELWLFDASERRLGSVEGLSVVWIGLPLAPTQGAAGDLDGDGCSDVLLADAEGSAVAVYGRCAARTLPPVAVIEAPEVLTLGGAVAPVRVLVGQTLHTRITDPSTPVDVHWTPTWGPAGLDMRGDELVFTPGPGDIGKWWVELTTLGSKPVTRGFPLWVVDVNAAPGEAPPPRAPAATVAVTLSGPPPPPPPRSGAPTRGRGCTVGLGIAAALSEAGGSAWENVGEADVRGGWSPLATAACAYGSKNFQVVAGADTAPFLTYGDQPNDRRHALAFSGGLQAAASDFGVGVFGTWGVTVRGVGARVTWTPVEVGLPSGPELRAVWLAPLRGGEVGLAWVVRLNRSAGR